MKLLFFEFKKVVFNQRFFALLLLVIAAIILLFLRNLALLPLSEEDERGLRDSEYNQAYRNSEKHGLKFERDPENTIERDLKQYSSAMIETLRELKNVDPSEGWQNKLTVENKFLHIVLKYNEAGEQFSNMRIPEIKRAIAMNEKLINDDIPPQHDSHSTALPNFMKQVADLYISFGAILLMLLLLGEIITSEFERHSINLLFTQPIKKGNILTSKLLISITAYTFITGFVFLITAITGLILGEKGTFDYPVLFEFNNVIEFMPISEYLIIALIGLSALVIFVILLFFLYSLLLRHTLSAILALLGTLLAGYTLTKLVPEGSLMWFNPFQYLMLKNTITFQNDSYWYIGLPILIFSSLVLYFLSFQKIKATKID